MQQGCQSTGQYAYMHIDKRERERERERERDALILLNSCFYVCV